MKFKAIAKLSVEINIFGNDNSHEFVLITDRVWSPDKQMKHFAKLKD